jgi:hypothetical protein
MPSTDTKPELTAKASMAQPVSQPAVYANGLIDSERLVSQVVYFTLQQSCNRLFTRGETRLPLVHIFFPPLCHELYRMTSKETHHKGDMGQCKKMQQDTLVSTQGKADTVAKQGFLGP